jgi:hypothetical protein
MNASQVLSHLHIAITLLWSRLAPHYASQDFSPDLLRDLRVRSGSDDVQEDILLVGRQIGSISTSKGNVKDG